MFCEGTKTEPDYINALKQEPVVRNSASVNLRTDLNASGAVPLTLVRAAATAQLRSSEEQGEIDEVWCLFDVEAPKKHPNLREARGIAQAGGVRLAISNPCFELWLALHFESQTAWLTSDAAERLRRKHDKSSGKEVDGSKYMPRGDVAAERAGRIPDFPVTRSHPPASWPSAANSSICRTYRKTAGEESRRRSPVANRWMRP